MQRERGGAPGPYGPLPPHIYRRRRLGVLAMLILTVAVTAGVFAAGSAPGDRGRAASTSKPPPGGAPAPSARPSPHRSDQSPTPKPTVTVTVTAAPRAAVTAAAPAYAGQRCRTVGVRLRVATNKNAYGDGDEPTITVRADPKKRCVLDPDDIDVVVTSGPDQVWSVQDCRPGDHPVWTAGPRHPYTFTVTWQRVRSNPATCGGRAPPAQPGWYTVEARLGDERSNEVVFRLK